MRTGSRFIAMYDEFEHNLKEHGVIESLYVTASTFMINPRQVYEAVMPYVSHETQKMMLTYKKQMLDYTRGGK